MTGAAVLVIKCMIVITTDVVSHMTHRALDTRSHTRHSGTENSRSMRLILVQTVTYSYKTITRWQSALSMFTCLIWTNLWTTSEPHPQNTQTHVHVYTHIHTLRQTLETHWHTLRSILPDWLNRKYCVFKFWCPVLKSFSAASRSSILPSFLINSPFF